MNLEDEIFLISAQEQALVDCGSQRYIFVLYHNTTFFKLV